MMRKDSLIYRVFDLYYDGFRHMTLGKTLWAVIIVKLIIIFAILKVFFFPNFISQHAVEGQEDTFVASELIDRQAPTSSVSSAPSVPSAPLAPLTPLAPQQSQQP